MPIATVAGNTTTNADRAKLRSPAMKSALPPWSGDGGDDSTSAPSATNTAVAIWAPAISRIVERTRRRRKPSSTAPTAMPRRNVTRMIVNTYVELPVPAPTSRFHTTW